MRHDDRSTFMQDELRHPLVEASALPAVVPDLLQPAVVGFGVLQGRDRIEVRTVCRKFCNSQWRQRSQNISTMACRTLEACRHESAHRNQDAVEVPVLFLVSVGIPGAQQLLEPPQPQHPQDGQVVFTAEGLEQREVDLQRHVLQVVGRQHAQDPTVWVSARKKRREPDELTCTHKE